MLSPLPPEGGCERVTITGVTAATKGQGATVYMAAASVQKILAKPAAPGKTATPPDDDDDDDIDNLKRLGDDSTKDGTKIAAAPVTPPPTGPTSGDYHLLKLYSQPVGIIAINPDDERKVSTMSKGIIGGRYLASKYSLEKGKRGVIAEVVIGEKLAKILKAKVGDVIGMDMGTVHNYALDRMFRVVGIFKTGLSDLDRGVVYIHIQNAWDKGLMGLITPETGKPAIHEMAIRLKKNLAGAPVAEKIRSQMNGNAMVRTWQQIEPSMANILKTQEAMTGLILAIILLIASFGTMNTMLMAVMERIKEFGVLKSIGMKPSWVGISS